MTIMFNDRIIFFISRTFNLIFPHIRRRRRKKTKRRRRRRWIKKTGGQGRGDNKHAQNTNEERTSRNGRNREAVEEEREREVEER